MTADDLARWTLDLCAIPSVTGDEDYLCTWTAERVAALAPGLAVTRVNHSLIVAGPRRPGVPTIGLFGHLDTVLPATDQPLEIRDGRVFGCGASDMKGGLAVMLGLLADHAALPAANLVWVFYEKEEGPSRDNGLDEVLDHPAFPALDLGICLEPTDNAIHSGCVGGLHATVTFRGRRAHSARPWQGDNAIYKATGFLERLRDRGRVPVEFAGLTFYEVMNATMASTVNSRNVVPDAFMLNVNYRFAPGKALATAREELLAVVAGEADVEVIDEAPSGAACHDHALVAAWIARAGLAVAPKQAWTDVARLTGRGIPAVNYGPGETAQAHQARESVAIADLATNHLALRQLLGAAT